MVKQSEERKSASPRSATENRPLSRNAQAQARLRARRRAYVESLEAEVKRLQSIVDATALHPGRHPHSFSTGSSSPLAPFTSPTQSFPSDSDSNSGSQPPDKIQQLQNDNDRLRRERDAFRVQVEALMGYVSRGCTLHPTFPNPSSIGSSLSGIGRPGSTSREIGQKYSPTPVSEMDSEDRQSQSCDLFSPSPLIQPSAYMKDELHQLLSLYGSNLAFSRQLDTHAQGSASHSSGGKVIQLPTLPGPNLFDAM
ncbi:hypothetical protein OPQ81_002460 [Rhizoctonia solani]|nr:hypothetical protein OPQ81_002460 [Rhizoctonia solani]